MRNSIFRSRQFNKFQGAHLLIFAPAKSVRSARARYNGASAATSAAGVRAGGGSGRVIQSSYMRRRSA